MHNQTWQAVCGFIVDACESLEAGQPTMRELFRMICDNNDARCALWYENGRARTMRYRDMRRRTAGIAHRIDLLIPPDAGTVALHMANAPEWPLLFWALLMTGHTPLLLDARHPPSQYASLLQQNGVSFIVTRDSHPGAVHPDALTRPEEEADPAFFENRWADRVIFHTSGTTGEPSLLVHDGSGLAGQLRSCRYFYRETADLIYPPHHGRIRQLALLPFSHIFGFTICILWYSFFGKEIVYPTGLSMNDLLWVCRRAEITHLCAVPRIFDHLVRGTTESIRSRLGSRGDELLRWLYGAEITDPARLRRLRQLADAVREQILGKSIRYMISGGAELSRVTATFLNRLGYCFCNGYGMTELGVLAVERSDDAEIRARGAIGRPSHGVRFEVDESGELLVDCDFAAKGRLVNGTFVPLPRPYPTRDQARLLPDGRVLLVGRSDDILIDSVGNRVHPGEIEPHFRKLAGETEVCVIGCQGKPALILSVPEGTDRRALSAGIDDCNAGLPLACRVHSAWLCPELPRTVKGEPDRRRTAELFRRGALPGEALAVNVHEAQDDALSELQQAVLEKYAQLLGIPGEQVSPTANFFTELGGDSLMYVSLLQWLEEEFGVSLSGESHESLTTVLKCAATVQRLRRT